MLKKVRVKLKQNAIRTHTQKTKWKKNEGKQELQRCRMMLTKSNPFLPPSLSSAATHCWEATLAGEATAWQSPSLSLLPGSQGHFPDWERSNNNFCLHQPCTKSNNQHPAMRACGTGESRKHKAGLGQKGVNTPPQLRTCCQQKKIAKILCSSSPPPTFCFFLRLGSAE